ncbi:MAG TPA: peptidylprolyl isomerase [Gemmatimonadaceae bacterium]|nr:peptidylprolyl isomerase [Gemmatimonadaceae bacterium]
MITRHLPGLALLLAAVAPAAAAQAIPAADTTAPAPAAVADSGGATVASIDGVVAVVGDQPILHTDVQERLGTLRAQGQQLPTDSAGQAQLYKQILDQLIDEELLVQQAKAEKLEVNDNDISGDVDRQLSQIRGRFASDAEFRSQLKGAGFGTPEEYRRWLMDQARRQQLQQKLFDKLRQDGKLGPAPVSEAEIDSFFQANKGQIERLPATVTYRQIVITPKPSAKNDSLALAKAESLLAEIRRGGDFAQIAKRESMDPGTKELGGDLGWHRRGEFVPEFDRMYFALPPGQVSPVIKTTYGYHIIKIDRVQPAEVKGRHILIRPQIDSADVERARHLADSVAALWRKGASYDSLVAKFHDPAEEKLMPEPFPKAQLPKEYQTAINGHKSGDILEPFEIQDASRGVPKFFILELTSVSDEREPTLSDYRERIRDQLAQQKGIRRYLDTLRKQTFVAVYGG